MVANEQLRQRQRDRVLDVCAKGNQTAYQRRESGKIPISNP